MKEPKPDKFVVIEGTPICETFQYPDEKNRISHIPLCTLQAYIPICKPNL